MMVLLSGMKKSTLKSPISFTIYISLTIIFLLIDYLPLLKFMAHLIMQVVPEVNSVSLLEPQIPLVLLQNRFVPSLLEALVRMLIVSEVDVQLSELSLKALRSIAPVRRDMHHYVLQLAFEEDVQDLVMIVIHLSKGLSKGDEVSVAPIFILFLSYLVELF